MARAAARYPPESETEDGEEEGGVMRLWQRQPKAEEQTFGGLAWGSDLMKKKGFKGSLADVGSSSKTFAVLAGVHSIVACLLKRFRGSDDAINAGIAGFVQVLLSVYEAGSPGVLLQSCLSFGTFSFLIQGLNENQDAISLPPMARGGNPGSPADVLLPFMLPLPLQFLEGFLSFCESSPKSKKIANN